MAAGFSVGYVAGWVVGAARTLCVIHSNPIDLSSIVQFFRVIASVSLVLVLFSPFSFLYVVYVAIAAMECILV